MLYVMDQLYEPTPFVLSKINTATQIVLAGAVIASIGFELAVLTPIISLLILAVAITTVTSGLAYMIEWWGRMNRLEDDL